MGKRLRWVLIFLSAAGFGALGWAVLAPHEPSYQGKTLNAWLEILQKGVDTDGQATPAIRAMGTNAIPFLLGDMQARDSRFLHWLAELARRQPWIKIPRRHGTMSRHYRGVLGFRALGREGRTAAPALAALLTNQNMVIREFSFMTLRDLGPDARSAIPVLLPMLGTNAPYQAVELLGEIHEQPAAVVPALAGLVAATNAASFLRQEALNALAQYGRAAAPAAPAITRALGDADADVAEAATNALKWADPAAAARAGVR